MQSQQEALGSRLESLTQTAENAMDREREAQDRLDSTLEQHAKQISQRQAREAELERSIQDLGAALVVARNRATKVSSSFSEDSIGENAAASNDVSVLRARIDALECDVETANAHLKLERERVSTKNDFFLW
jgi:chromosome segregation ATPase